MTPTEWLDRCRNTIVSQEPATAWRGSHQTPAGIAGPAVVHVVALLVLHGLLLHSGCAQAQNYYVQGTYFPPILTGPTIHLHCDQIAPEKAAAVACIGPYTNWIQWGDCRLTCDSEVAPPGTVWGLARYIAFEFSCGTGEVLNRQTAECVPISDNGKNLGPTCDAVSNPVNPATGNKYQTEVDYEGGVLFPLRFVRTYNSALDQNGDLGYGWTRTFGQRLAWVIADKTVAVTRPDGNTHYFGLINGGSSYGEKWITDADITARLERLTDGDGATTGWRYTATDDTVENYDAEGRLVGIEDLRGNSQTLTYDTGGRLQTVTTSAGASLDFAYDPIGHLASLTDHTGRVWGYRYDGDDNLEYVDRPDGTTRRYHYEDPDFPHALTGITDERGVRYATYAYDAQGRAVTSTHALDAERIAIAYNGDGTRTVTNGRGVITTYATGIRLGVNLVTDIAGPGCATCGGGNTRYTYDSANNIAEKTENGLTTAYGSYDSRGNYGYRIEAVGTAEERRTDYSYDPRFHNKIATITEPSVHTGSNRITTYTYDDYGNRTSTAIDGFDPAGNPVTRTMTYQYAGPLHQLSQIDGPRTDVSDISTYEYYPDDPAQGNNRARLKRIIGPTGIVERDALQYTATGRLASESRPNGLSVSYSYYPGNDRLETLTETDGATSRTTRWTWLPTGEVASITTAFGTVDATTLSFGYDAARRLIRITDGLGNHIDYTLDSEGNREAQSIYDADGQLRNASAQTFDVYNRLDLVSRANESRDDDYAPDGTLDRQTDGNGVITGYDYDALRRLLSSTRDQGGTDPGTADALSRYAYDTAGRLTSVNDPVDGTTTYVYDDLGNRLSVNSPDTGTATYRYDGAGNRVQKIDALGQAFSYRYDALDRLTVLDAPGTAGDVTYTYDTCPNGIGRLCAVTMGSESVAYAYDAYGDIISHQDVTYAYNAAGRVKSMTLPSGAVVTYHHDAAGQVNQVDLMQAGGTATLASAITYAPFGRMTGLLYGNGLTLSRALDLAYRYTSVDVSGVLGQNAVQYDANGNVLGWDEGIAYSFGYDALNRLDLASGGFGIRDYDYDPNGNRTALVGDALTTAYGYEAMSNRLASETGWTYTLDANGNTLARRDAAGAGRLYAYTAHNRLATATDRTVTQGHGKKPPTIDEVRLATYVYNGLGQRIQKDVNGAPIRYHYGIDGALLAEVDADGVPRREYVYLDDQPLVVLDYSGAVPAGGEELILDNGDAGTGGSGVWQVKNSNKDYGADYLLADGATGSTYRWTPGVSAGAYDVYLWWVSNKRYSKDVPYILLHNGVTETFTLDQRTNGSQWVSLGSYVFAGTRDEYLEVSDVNGRTVADAVRFAKQAGTGELADASVYYIHSDHLGTPRSLTNAAGIEVWNAIYDPFGRATVEEDPDGNGMPVTLNLRFPGQYYDQETGCHYNYFRYYCPDAGRYLTADPVGLAGGFNTYTYALNNPLFWTDPLGLEVLVTLYKGQRGNVFNHVGVGTTLGPNAHQTFGLGPNSGIGLLSPVPGHISRDKGEPTATVIIPTTPAQDALVNAYNDAAVNDSNSMYSLLSNSCVDHVRAALNAGGIEIPAPVVGSGRNKRRFTRGQNTNLPNTLFDSLAPLGTLIRY